MVNEKFYKMFTKTYDYNPTCGYTFGPGCSAKVGEKLAMYQRKNVLLLTGPVVRSLGYADQIAKTIEAVGIAYEIYDKTEVNPSQTSIYEAYNYVKDKGFDAIVAVGGGSVEDSAKALRHLLANPDHTLSQIAVGAGFQYYPRKSPMMLFMVPTMSGTGCELSVGAVITSPQGTKDTLMSGDTSPDYAFIDPNFSVTVDEVNTLANACDAIAHAFNKLLITDGNYYMQNLVNMDLFKILWEVLPKLQRDPGNIQYRSAMAIATAMPMFYGGTGCWHHAVAHTITHFFGTPHGIACAWVQPAVPRHYLPKCKATTAQLAEYLQIDPYSKNVVDQIADKFVYWYKSVGVPAPSDCCDHETFIKMAPDVPKDTLWFMAGGNYPERIEDVLEEIYYDFD